MGILVESPARTDVIVAQEFIAPGFGIDHVAIPLDQQQVLGFDMPEQVFHDEARIRLKSGQRPNGDMAGAAGIRAGIR
jgi:hypothetical protein